MKADKNKTKNALVKEFRIVRNKIVKHMALILILVVFFFVIGSFRKSSHSAVDFFSNFFVVVATLYFLVLLFALMMKSVKTLLITTRFLSLIEWYVVFTVAFIVSVSFVHSAIGGLELGSLNDSDGNEIHKNEMGKHIYFTSITYFSVGYGDIYPTGFNRGLAVFNALIGHLFNLIIMALAISNFLQTHRNAVKK